MAVAVGSSAFGRDVLFTRAQLWTSWLRAIGAEEAAVQAAFEARAVTLAERDQFQHHLRDERAWLRDRARTG